MKSKKNKHNIALNTNRLNIYSFNKPKYENFTEVLLEI